jgi:hypothetical protein
MNDRIHVGTRKGLFTLERTVGAGAGWSIVGAEFLGDNVPMVMSDDRDGALYVALSLGHFGEKLHRSDDGGKHWIECGVPAFHEGADLPSRDQEGVRLTAKLELIWSLESGGPDQSGVVWAGTIPGGLFRSDDRGESWTLMRSLWDEPSRQEWFGGGYDKPGIHSICVDPRDANRVLIGVSCGGVWETLDGGATWTCRAKGMRAEYMPPERAFDAVIQDPHRMVQCASSPDSLWVAHHNGVFKSSDGAANWVEIEDVPPSVFGFATAVHPSDPDTAWFVPAIKDEKRIPVNGAVVVTRTRDGGKSFDVLRDGLPGEHAYDIVFRHALDVDSTGDCLVVGSTTGSLWISENGGDSFVCVTNHLPPIYCTRFAK